MILAHLKKILVAQAVFLSFAYHFELYSSDHLLYQILGVNEFVQESIFISSQGKFGIKELQGKNVEEMPSDAFLTYEETIVENDILNINVFHPSRRDWMESIHEINERRGGVPVHNGCVTMPGIDSIRVSGMTLEEAREAIKSQLKVKDTKVFITFREKKSNVVELCGFTAKATIPVNGKIQLYEILAKAHIPSDTNLFASYVLRDGNQLKVDLHKLLTQGDMSQNIVMKGGDKIFIAPPKTDFAVLLEETVNLPSKPVWQGGSFSKIPLHSGSATLHEALVMAKGIPNTTCEKYVQVIRRGSNGIKIFVLPWNIIYTEPNYNLLLIPDDIVYVSLTPISQWKVLFDQLEKTLITMPYVMGSGLTF